MGGSHIVVENVDWFAWLDVAWELPCLAEVFGACHREEIVRVAIAPARRFDWSIWSNCLFAEVFIIDENVFMDMLARVAIPKRVLAPVLPPFSFHVCE